MPIFSPLIACLVLCLAFPGAYSSESFGTPHNVLGANLVTDIDPRTGFISGRDSRINIYGESSSVSFHFKPHDYKLKVTLEQVHSCFDVRCHGSQVFMKSKLTSRGNLDCISAGVDSFSSSSRTTGRILRYDLQRQPSLNDLRGGDFLYLDPTCSVGRSQARIITSIDRLSGTVKGSQSTLFVISTREAAYVDAFSEGTYEFRTDNILTVNEIPENLPNLKPKFFGAVGNFIGAIGGAVKNGFNYVAEKVANIFNNEDGSEMTLSLVNLVRACSFWHACVVTKLTMRTIAPISSHLSYSELELQLGNCQGCQND